MRGRGLKPLLQGLEEKPPEVAPRAGAWIETFKDGDDVVDVCVAPRAGAWIETTLQSGNPIRIHVAPRAGAWIETSRVLCVYGYSGRPPCGGVD